MLFNDMVEGTTTTTNSGPPPRQQDDPPLTSSTSSSAEIIQRKQRLHSMVFKRKSNFAYLKKTMEGTGHWLNCVRLTKADIRRFVRQNVPNQRTIMYLYLSMSISNLLGEMYSSNAQVVRAFLQLLEEYEYYFSGTTVQSVKYLMAKNSPSMFPVSFVAPTSSSSGSQSTTAIPSGGIASQNNNVAAAGIGPSAFAGLLDNDDTPTLDTSDSGVTPQTTSKGRSTAATGGPSIHKFDSTIVFEHLITCHVPFELDHVEVCVGLCEILISLYDRFPCEECYTNAVIYDSIMKIDGRMKRYVVSLIAKELTDFCTVAVKNETESLR